MDVRRWQDNTQLQEHTSPDRVGRIPRHRHGCPAHRRTTHRPTPRRTAALHRADPPRPSNRSMPLRLSPDRPQPRAHAPRDADAIPTGHRRRNRRLRRTIRAHCRKRARHAACRAYLGTAERRKQAILPHDPRTPVRPVSGVVRAAWRGHRCAMGCVARGS